MNTNVPIQRIGVLLLFSISITMLLAHALQPGQMFYYRDFWQLYYPHFHWGAEVIQSGSFPLWNPFIGSGYPVFASMVHGYAYPPFLLTLVFTPEWGIKLFIAGHLFWAGLGTYWLCRRWEMSVHAALFSSVSFMLSGPLVSGINNLPYLSSPSWIPWALGCYTLALTNRFWIFPTAGTMACMALAGEAQTCYFTGFLFCFFSLAHFQKKEGPRLFLECLKRFSWIVGVALLLAAVQIWPALEFGLQSERIQGISEQDSVSFSCYWEDLPRVLVPFIYGNPTTLWYGRMVHMQAPFESSIYVGILPLFFAGLALFSPIPKPRKRFLLGGFLFFVLASVGTDFPLYLWLRELHVPLWNSFRYPEKLLLPAEFLWILLAGFGMDHWFSAAVFPRKWWGIGMGFLMGILLLILTFFLPPFESFQDQLNQQGAMNRAYQLKTSAFWAGITLLFVFLSCKTPKKMLLLWGASLLIAVELVYYHRQILPTTSMAFYNGTCPSPLAPLSGEHFYRMSLLPHEVPAYRGYPLEPFVQSYRKWGLGNLSILYQIHQDWGVMPTCLNTYAKLRQSMVQSLQEKRSQSEQEQDPLLRRLSVRRVIQKIEDPQFGSSQARILFEVPQPRPRFSLIFQTISAPNESEALKKMASLSPEIAVILEQDATLPSLEPFPLEQASLELFASVPNQIRFRVSVPKSVYLLVSDNFYMGWFAQVDTGEVKCIRADVSFRLISIPEGSHEVLLYYRPISFYGGLLISLFSWILLGIHGFRSTRKKNGSG